LIGGRWKHRKVCSRAVLIEPLFNRNHGSYCDILNVPALSAVEAFQDLNGGALNDSCRDVCYDTSRIPMSSARPLNRDPDSESNVVSLVSDVGTQSYATTLPREHKARRRTDRRRCVHRTHTCHLSSIRRRSLDPLALSSVEGPRPPEVTKEARGSPRTIRFADLRGRHPIPHLRFQLRWATYRRLRRSTWQAGIPPLRKNRAIEN